MAVIATGFFDGVHIGHRLLLQTLVAESRRKAEEAVVITFWPHPRTVLQHDARDFRLLSSMEEKKNDILSLGVDDVQVLPFSRDFAALTAREYLKFLMFKYEVSTIVLGYDTRLGSDQKGPEEVSQIAGQLGIQTLTAGREGVVSSTKIRTALSSGDVSSASLMLGKPYELKGIVVAGNHVGTTLGFPTANIQVCDPLKLVPGRGVYLTEVVTMGKVWKGMTNIGFHPTVGASSAQTIETNILDFDEMIYGYEITVRFIRKIRDEKKFDSVSELSAQLAADREECRCQNSASI